MSVLTNLSIAYESLPGEPSFFVTNQQATPTAYETQQESLSLPYISETPKVRVVLSNFDISPSFSTRRTVNRPAGQRQTTVSHVSKSQTKLAEVSHARQVQPAEKPASISRQIVTESRGLFNEFERASLLSYMQRRQFS